MDQPMISLDTETTGIDMRHGARPFLVTMCDEGGFNHYWEWDVEPETREILADPNELREINDFLLKADAIVLQNAKFDYTGLNLLMDGKDGRPKLWWDWSKVHDTLLAGHLLASNQPHDLTTMALVYCGVNIKPLEDAVKKAVEEAKRIVKVEFPDWRIAKKGLPEMPSAKEKVWAFDMWLPRAVARAKKYPKTHPWWTVCSEYANGDSSVTLPLLQRQEKLLKERKLWRIYLERLKVLPVVAKMEAKGITLSKTRLDELTESYTESSTRAGRVCVNIAKGFGHGLELPKSGVNNSLKQFVFEVLKLPVVEKTKTGNPCLDKNVLEHYMATLPAKSKSLTFMTQLRGKRSRDTALNYMESYKRYWLPLGTRLPDWFVMYPSLNPTGTDTLRFSSSNPNEQNISKKEDFNLRYMFGPAPGREWWSLDYENIELRIPAYESNERIMIELFERPDDPPYFGSYHLMNASIIYPDLFWPLAEKKGAFKKKYASTWYQWVKNFGFAVSYGAVVDSGTADRAAHKPGAQKMVMSRLKEHTKLNQRMIDYAKKHGYVETIPDKTVDPNRGYPILCSRSRWGQISPTVPLNYHVQSTAMWCTMKAMIRCHEYLSALKDCHITLQVHDEMVFDLPSNKGSNKAHISKLKSLMEQSGDDIGVPLTVAASYHPHTWGESSEE